MALYPLSGREAALPAGAYDVRGWEVRTRTDDHHVGTVRDMLLDGDDAPRYLDVTVEAVGRHVLLPLDRAWADRSHETVLVRELTADRFEALPPWEGDPSAVTPGYEARLSEEYDRLARGDGRRPSRPDDSRLVRLSDMEDHRVSDDSRDVRGWPVVGGDGGELGEVAELLVDREELHARYLDCVVDEDGLELEPVDRHVLLPVEHVRIDGSDKRVVVDRLFAPDVADYPVYDGLPLDEGVRGRISAFFREGSAAPDGGTARPRAERRGERAAAPAGLSGRLDPAAAGFFRDPAGTPDEEPGRTAPGSGDRVVMEERSGDSAVLRKGEQRVRIRITGDDIVVEEEGGVGRG